MNQQVTSQNFASDVYMKTVPTYKISQPNLQSSQQKTKKSQINLQDPTTEFLKELASKESVSKNAAHLKLVRKLNEKSKIIEKRKKQKQRMEKMTLQLRTTNAELRLVEDTIKEIQDLIKNKGTDEE